MQSETQNKERPVIKAIATVMATVGSVEKRGRNDFHRYDYATAADIAHALQKKMAEAGLVIIPTQRELSLMDDGNVLAIRFAFSVEHESGDRLDERPEFTGMSAARNSKGGFDDKAANKCLTAASKYFVLNLFKIPTGDYHDADGEEDKPKQSGQTKPRNDPKPEPKPEMTAEQRSADYAQKQIDYLKSCNTHQDLFEWQDTEAARLSALQDRWTKYHKMIMDQYETDFARTDMRMAG